MTRPDPATLYGALDSLLDGGPLSLLVGGGARPLEMELTAAAQAALRPHALRAVQEAIHALPPDADGYAPARDAAASYDAAIAAKKEKTT